MRRNKDAKFIRTFQETDFILAEAVVIEALRRSDSVELHPRLENTLLIYDNQSRQKMKKLYLGFTRIAADNGLPLMLCAPTWRANRERLASSGVEKDVNRDCVGFMESIRQKAPGMKKPIYIGGLMGCKNDCYRPEDALSEQEAADFHSWQAEKLADTDLDFLLAATLPSTKEAKGLAKAIAATSRPYFISFVIGSNGLILDGSSLERAIDDIDQTVTGNQPIGYLINCAYPSFLKTKSLPPATMDRLVGFQANASSREQSELDGSTDLMQDDIDDWGKRMVGLHHEHGFKILGGCCGTGPEHLEYLCENL